MKLKDNVIKRLFWDFRHSRYIITVTLLLVYIKNFSFTKYFSAIIKWLISIKLLLCFEHHIKCSYTLWHLIVPTTLRIASIMIFILPVQKFSIERLNDLPSGKLLSQTPRPSSTPLVLSMLVNLYGLVTGNMHNKDLLSLFSDHSICDFVTLSVILARPWIPPLSLSPICYLCPGELF